MKHLVETKGSFMLMDPETGANIPHYRPAVVKSTNFIEGRVSQGQLKIHAADISGEATDEAFQSYWDESPEMAIEAFLSEFAEAKLEDVTGRYAALEEAVAVLDEGDFQKDGKPKVGPLDKLVEGFKVDTVVRDEFWEAFNDQG